MGDSNAHSIVNNNGSLSEKLLSLAGYGKISATSYSINACLTNTCCMNSACHTNNTVTNMLVDVDNKIYIPVFIKNYRIVGCVDSGSDITIMHMNLFTKIFRNASILMTSDIPFFNTFSEHSVQVKGMIKPLVKLAYDHPGITVPMYIINDIPGSPSLLLGNDLLKLGMVTLAYTGIENDPYPEIIFNYPIRHQCTVYFEPHTDLYTCETRCKLSPYEMKDVEFILPKASPVIRTDHILITSQEWDTISILPARSDLEFVTDHDRYYATGRVVNLSDQTIDCHIKGKFELINNYDVIKIDENNKGRLTRALELHPLGREILMTKDQARINLPLFTVNHISQIEGNEMSVSDLDYADAIMSKEPTYEGEAIIDPEIIDPTGIDLPTVIHSTASEAIDLNAYSEEIRPFIKEIFIDKYPSVVSLHSLDAGNLSLTLGYTQLRLREGEMLPRAKRIFHISPSDQRHLDDICELLIKWGYIMRSPMEPDGSHLYGMSAYLVPRSKPNCLGRLIVDFSPVNQLIQSPPSVIPEISATLQFLQGKALYTSLDLRYAYLALRIDEASRKLTTFITPSGSYRWLALPTGAANSPAHFTDACNRILHYEPVYDDEGNLVYESKNVVKQKRDVLEHVCNYFDDILATSPLKSSYEETLRFHFSVVEKCVKRLAFHGAKISVMKCEFARSKILFLGWYVSHNFFIADPRRIQKIKDFKFPENKKAVRAFLGLANSLRRVCTMNIIEHISILTPLTSSKIPFKPEQKHKIAFEKIKELMTSEPLYGKLIDEKAEKYLWVDAATSSGVLGAVLAQKVKGDPNEKIVPPTLDLDDPVHRIIFNKELPYEPVKLYTQLPIVLPRPSQMKTIPPTIESPGPLLGFTPENVHDAFFWSTLSILAFYNCTVPTIAELRKMAMRKLKSGILNNKLKDFTFNLNYNAYHEFCDKFLKGEVGMDPELFLADALASAIHRPMIFISSLKKHVQRPIFRFNHTIDKPPLIYGIYERDGKDIFLPYFLNKNQEFRLDHLKGKIEIIAYLAKTVPEMLRSRPILDLETFAILIALHSFQRYISGVKVELLSDSKVLYYLFHKQITDSSVKTKRWCYKLASDYPLLSVRHVKSAENLADFLTREGLPPGDIEKFNLKDVQINDFFHKLPKSTFTLAEWIKWVEENPQYLVVNHPTKKEIKAVALSIKRGIENVENELTPINILKERLLRSEIIKNQKLELAHVYEKCLASDDFEYIPDIDIVDSQSGYVKYKLVNDLLMIYKGFYKIYIPPSMVGLLLSFTHLLGHKGLTRMFADLQSYYFDNLYSVTKRFITSCYSCFLVNKSNKRNKIGVYPAPSYPMQEINLDLAENLNSVNGYSHLLVTQCELTDFVQIFPMKSKQAEPVTNMVLAGVIQPFNVQRIHSDNGPCFRSHQWLRAMAAFNVQIIASAALHPQGRGQIERLVGTIKLMLKKMLAVKSSLNWEFLPFLCAKIINNTVSPKTGFTPQQMVFGNLGDGNSFLNPERFIPPHFMVLNDKQMIDQLTADIKEMTRVATERLLSLRLLTNERLNKNKIVKDFKANDYVFVLDRLQIPGNSRPLKTKFHPSPYIVVKTYTTTTLVKRLADGFMSVYSNDDLKKYSSTSPLFKDLPPQVSKVLLHDFKNLLESDLCTITKYDPFELPRGIELFEHNDASDYNEIMINEGTVPYINEEPDEPNILEQEEQPIQTESQISKIQKSLDNKTDVPPIPDNVGINTEELDSEDQEILETIIAPGRDLMEDDLNQISEPIDDKEQSENESESDEEQNEEPEGYKNINLRKGKKQVRIQLPSKRRRNPPQSS